MKPVRLTTQKMICNEIKADKDKKHADNKQYRKEKIPKSGSTEEPYII